MMPNEKKCSRIKTKNETKTRENFKKNNNKKRQKVAKRERNEKFCVLVLQIAQKRMSNEKEERESRGREERNSVEE